MIYNVLNYKLSFTQDQLTYNQPRLKLVGNPLSLFNFHIFVHKFCKHPLVLADISKRYSLGEGCYYT